MLRVAYGSPLLPLGVAPFLFPGWHDVWPKHVKPLRETFRVPRIFALQPRFELWSRPFADWTEEDWSTCGLSALWELDSGRVLWAHGAHDVAAMPTVGRTAPEFFGVPTGGRTSSRSGRGPRRRPAGGR